MNIRLLAFSQLFNECCKMQNLEFSSGLKEPKLTSGEIAVISNIQSIPLAVLPQTAYLGFRADFLTCHIGLGLLHFCQLLTNGLRHIGEVEVGPIWQTPQSLM